MCDRLEMDLNLLLLKNDLIMLKNEMWFCADNRTWFDGVGCCHLIQSKNPHKHV